MWCILFRVVNLLPLQTLYVLWHLALAIHYYIYYYYIIQPFYAGYLQLHTWNKIVSTAQNVGTFMYLQTLLHIMLCSTWNMSSALKFAHSKMCTVCNMAVFVVAWFRALLLCCSGIVWLILRRFQLSLLLQVSLLLSHSTCSKFLL